MSSVQSESQVTDGAHRSTSGKNEDQLAALSQEIKRLNTIGKRFVASLDRFQVHRALLAALQGLYNFSACCILLKGDPYELFIIPCYPLAPSFIQAMIQRIASAAAVIDFPHVDVDQLAASVYLDAPDDLSQPRQQTAAAAGTEIGSSLNIPLIADDRIIGLLSLFDEKPGTFDTELLQMTTMIADYSAIALENVHLRERENAHWRQAEFERQRLELIIGSMAEGLLITDVKESILSFNNSAQKLLAQAHVNLQQALPLRTAAMSSDAPWLSRLADIITEALQGTTVFNQELVIGITGENIPLTLSISAAPLHDARGATPQPIGVVTVLNDVTSIKQVEHMKDEFISVVSHELRTPLTAIKGYTQHLIRRIERRIRKQQTTEPKVRGAALPIAEPVESYDLHSLNIIQSQVEHLERLVNDLLDLSQIQWGPLHLHIEDFYLADLLSEQVHLVQASAEQHIIALDIALADSKVAADRTRVGQVIGNLLDNAIKYSPQGSQVTVRLQENDGDYLVSVADQGVGVSAEHFEHIFERFYRVHNTSSHQYTGIGLGLYVAKVIVEGHGGRIWFNSPPGSGSTFLFTLPHSSQPALSAN
ncbi:MAG TPA: ATP-binding protein [Ktedonobacteraceae bacterium]|nr:ATP-binding protein [Ktedonobacteraceae bacterium]